MSVPTIIADTVVDDFERELLDDFLGEQIAALRRTLPSWKPTILLRREQHSITVTTDQLAPAIAALRRAQRREKRAT